MHGITEVAPEIRVIRLPLPFELNHVNVGLVPLDDGYMLIDTGLDTDAAFAALSASMAETGIAWTAIRRILLTHMHPDHVGMLPRLRALTGAEVLIHRAEAEYLNAIVAAGRAPWIDEALRTAGAPAPLATEVHEAMSDVRRSLRHLDPDVALEGGEEIATALGPMQIVWTPGHSVGHICLYWPERKLMYSGDHMIEKITPNIPWLPGRDCLAEYLASLQKLIPLEIDKIFPSHGKPFSGHVDWIEKTTAHHAARCEQIAHALEAKPLSAHELVPALWNRRLSPFNYHFALSEVLAHLEYMSRQGRIAKTDDEGVPRWVHAS